MLKRLYRLLGLLPCDWCGRYRWCTDTRLGRYLRRRCRKCCSTPGGFCTPVADAIVPQPPPVLPGLPYAPSFLGDVRSFYTKRTGPGTFEGLPYRMERYSFYTAVVTDTETLPDLSALCARLPVIAAINRAAIACEALLETPVTKVPEFSFDYLLAAANQIRVRSGIRDTEFTLVVTGITAIHLKLQAGRRLTSPGCDYGFTVYVEDTYKPVYKKDAEGNIDYWAIECVPVFPDATAAVVAPFAWETWELEPTLDARPLPRDRVVQVALTDTFTVVEAISHGTVLLRFPVVGTSNPPGI